MSQSVIRQTYLNEKFAGELSLGMAAAAQLGAAVTQHTKQNLAVIKKQAAAFHGDGLLLIRQLPAFAGNQSEEMVDVGKRLLEMAGSQAKIPAVE